MPDFPIIDTHVHFTKVDRICYSNLKTEAPALHRSIDLAAFQSDTATVDLEAFLFMEVFCDACDRAEEARWVTELASQDSRLQGIIAGAGIGDGAAVAAELEAYAQNPLIKGVRRVLQTEAVDFCVQPAFIEGLRCLPTFDFSFDICVFSQHLPYVAEMIRACPEVRFILDHIGKPPIRDQVFEPWKTNITSLAELPNVQCKVSGMATEADLDNWTRDDLRPYFDHVIENFGFDRLIYGGDWFVATLATTYPEWVATVDWAVSGCSDDELRKLYQNNARSFYRL